MNIRDKIKRAFSKDKRVFIPPYMMRRAKLEADLLRRDFKGKKVKIGYFNCTCGHPDCLATARLYHDPKVPVTYNEDGNSNFVPEVELTKEEAMADLKAHNKKKTIDTTQK